MFGLRERQPYTSLPYAQSIARVIGSGKKEEKEGPAPANAEFASAGRERCPSAGGVVVP
jgi:hypothetical protein